MTASSRDFPALRRYRDFEQMLDEQQPDLLSIATPARWHAPQTILAATRYPPRAILCEKPMAVSLGEARAMLAACEQHGVKLAIGHMMRWYTVHEQARALVAEGAIGTPLTATVSLESGGLMNNGTHALSYMQYVLGDPDPEWVIANVQRRSDRYERGWPSEELSGGWCRLPAMCACRSRATSRPIQSTTGTCRRSLAPTACSCGRAHSWRPTSPSASCAGRRESKRRRRRRRPWTTYFGANWMAWPAGRAATSRRTATTPVWPSRRRKS